jgi:hypothetical protein
MPHIVLLGDSIFDNAAYVGGGSDVIRQLRAALPPGWHATLNAVDGVVVAGIADQLARLPADASHLVLSGGGNDALAEANLLHHPAASVLDALEKLAAVRRDEAAVCGLDNGGFASDLTALHQGIDGSPRPQVIVR